VSIEDLLAVSLSDRSQDLTRRIRDLIRNDHHRGEGGDTDGLPSPVGESETFVKMFMDPNWDKMHGNLLEMSKIDMGKVKKIEFSQSIKKGLDDTDEPAEKVLPFTHKGIDKLVFSDTKGVQKPFDLDDARKFLKNFSKLAKSSLSTEHSFDLPKES